MLSLFRKLTYDHLSKLELNGLILDLGGSRKSGYHELFRGKYNIQVVNLDDRTEPNLKFNLEKEFPLKNNFCDGILCINVLEHVFNFQNVVNEAFRVVKPGGVIVSVTPFLFSVHESPHDYFRYTRGALEKIFQKAGFREVEIKEIGTGLFSAVCQLKFGFYKIDIIRRISIFFHLCLDKILQILRPNSFITQKNMPLGYLVVAKK